MSLAINLQELKDQRPHFPVLIREILENIIDNTAKKESKTILDCTFGAGGYSEYILKNSNYKIIGIDRDTKAQEYFKIIAKIYNDRITFNLSKFSNLEKVLEENNIKMVEGILIDLGFSSMQLKDYSRGFSFKSASNLDMTMGLNSFSAKEFINSAKETMLADVIYYYGEETKAKRIAKAIVEKRAISTINTTKELYDIIIKITGRGHYKKTKIDPATKTFQAIRIYVNDELKELQKALNSAIKSLNSKGKLLVVSFHSLEDRIVKDFFNEKINSNLPNINYQYGTFTIINKKPITPKEDEITINAPSSSAKLRILEKN